MKNTLRLLVTLVLGIFACLVMANTAQNPNDLEKQNIRVYFTQMANYATLDSKNENNKTIYQLVLHNVNQKTSWMADRPARVSGTLASQEFVKLWNQGANSFSDNNPNASLVALSDDNGMRAQTQVIFKLSHPEYDAQKHNLTYVVDGVLKPVTKTEFHHVALFIDSLGCLQAFPWC